MLLLCVLLATPVGANPRLKDYEGVRDNRVVGLQGIGDSRRDLAFAEEGREAMLERLGTSTRGLELPTTDRFTARGEVESVMQGVPNSARLAVWTIVDPEVDSVLDRLESVRLALRNPYLTTSRRIAQTIHGPLSRVTAPATAVLEVPPSDRGQTATRLTGDQQLRMQPDQPARIVIDERSGTIVSGAALRISQVALAQGNLTVRVAETPQVSQPGPLAESDTVVVARTGLEVEEDGGRTVALEGGVSLQDLVTGLNALGVGPRDLIGILQALKAAGALQAEIVVM